ncbi:hypothetical protein QYB63_001669 [Clostridium perfringens]|nr:hypothetical protein [Clostridium perfringens]
MILNRKYTVSALDRDKKHLANYPDRILNKQHKLNYIIREYIQGIHIISGMRGVGKTTFINLFKDEDIKDGVFIHLNVLDESFDLVSEIVINLENLIEKKILNCSNECKERINKLKYKIFNEVLIKKSFETKFSSSKMKKLQRMFGVNIKKYFDINLSNNLTVEESEKNEFIYETISTPIQKQEKNIKELIYILKEISKYKHIVIILDEIDKLSNDKFDVLLEKNKELFLESGLVYLIVCDNKKYINIKFNKTYGDMINRYIYLPLLSWEEYLIISAKIKEFRSIDSVKKSYCKTLGNYRKLITYEEDDELEQYSNNFWNVINEIEKSNIYRNLPESFRDIIKEVLFDILNILKISTYLTDKEIDSIKNEHKFINNINIIIDRLIELLQTSQYIEYINGKYTLKEDERVFFNNKSEDLENEILKVCDTKRFWRSRDKDYRIDELTTTNIEDLICIITWYREDLDAVLIFRQELTDININNISYHVVILTSNKLNSIAFVNVGGFSWNSEYSSRYNEMKQYLSDRNILYKEYELKKDEKLLDVFKNNQYEYISDLEELSWEYIYN